jgi:hypothetical protein
MGVPSRSNCCRGNFLRNCRRISNRFCSSATPQVAPDAGAVGASCLTIPGVNNSVRIGPRSEVMTSSTSTVLNISSASSRSPAALRVS